MKLRKLDKIVFTLAALAIAGGCSKGNSSSGGTPAALNFSGTLGVTNSAQSGTTNGDVSAQTVDYTALKVVCATLTAPIVSGTGSFDSSGNFTVSISGGAGQPIACALTDTSGTKVADFLISDSSKKDINGNNRTTASAVYKTDANLGSITYDQGSGEVSIPKANVSSALDTTVVAASSMFDPTGAWTVADVDFTLPKGARGTCSASEQNNGTCHGPPTGMSLYFKLWKGVQSSDSSSIAGMQLWQGQTAYDACGHVIGLTSTTKTQLGVDFSQNGSADTTFTYATSVANFHDNLNNSTGTVNLTNGWKMDTAKTQWDMQSACYSQSTLTLGSTTYNNVWICGPDANSRYQASLAGGCTVTATGATAQITDWSGITSCGSGATDSNDGNHVMSQTCTGTATVGGASTAVTCTNKWVIMTRSGSSPNYTYSPTANTFNWNDLAGTTITKGTLCSAMGTGSEPAKIAQLQCYANHYQQSGMENASACLPRVNVDWTTNVSANYAQVDTQRPTGLVFFEKWDSHPDGNGGSMTTRQEHYDGAQVDANSWTSCRVVEMGSLSMRVITANKLFVTYESSVVNASTSKPACAAKFTGKREMFVFYVTK